MSTVLILPSAPLSGDEIAFAVESAGFSASVMDPREPLYAAVERTAAYFLMLDTDADAREAYLLDARRLGVTVIYFSTVLSAYDLAVQARGTGVLHFPITGNPRLLRRMIIDSLRLEADVLRARDEVALARSLRRARALVARSEQLIEQSRLAVATAQELRATKRVAVAACQNNYELLREAIAACAREMHEMGATLDRVQHVVHAGLDQGRALGSKAPFAWDDVEHWTESAYRAAS